MAERSLNGFISVIITGKYNFVYRYFNQNNRDAFIGTLVFNLSYTDDGKSMVCGIGCFYFVSNGLLQLKVIGKKNPILCYKLTWRDEITPEHRVPNYTIVLAPDTTSHNFVTQIENILQ